MFASSIDEVEMILVSEDTEKPCLDENMIWIDTKKNGSYKYLLLPEEMHRVVANYSTEIASILGI